MNIVDLIVMACCLASCFRLMFYRRSGSTFKRHISVIAWIAIVITGGIGLLILTGDINSLDMGLIGNIAIYMFTALVFIAQGNISQLIRITRGQA